MPEPGQLIHLRQRRWLVEAVEEHDGGLISTTPAVPLVNHFTGLAESGMVQSFAACGFAAEPVTAAWLPSW